MSWFVFASSTQSPEATKNLVVVPDVRSSGGVELTSDAWRQPLVRPNVRPFFSFLWRESIFLKKRGKKTSFLTARRGHSTCPPYTLVRCTVKTDTTDIQAVDSDCSKAIRKEMQEVRKTQERDERVEKRSYEIELRGAHLKLDYYNGKQVLLHTVCYMSLKSCMWGAKRNTLIHIHIWWGDIYRYTYIHIYIHSYMYICVYIYTPCLHPERWCRCLSR